MGGARVDRDELARLHRLGFSAAQISVQLGCAERTVVRCRKDAGLSASIPANAAYPVTAERLDAARRMFDDGASRMDVCRTLGMAIATLRQHFPDACWTRRESGQYAQLVRQLNQVRVAS